MEEENSFEVLETPTTSMETKEPVENPEAILDKKFKKLKEQLVAQGVEFPKIKNAEGAQGLGVKSYPWMSKIHVSSIPWNAKTNNESKGLKALFAKTNLSKGKWSLSFLEQVLPFAMAIGCVMVCALSVYWMKYQADTIKNLEGQLQGSKAQCQMILDNERSKIQNFKASNCFYEVPTLRMFFGPKFKRFFFLLTDPCILILDHWA